VRTLYLDPGTFDSFGVILDGFDIVHVVAVRNEDLPDILINQCYHLVIEGVTPQSAAGTELFQTIWWSGRFCQAAVSFEIVNRVDVKKFFKALSQYDGNMTDTLIKTAIKQNYPERAKEFDTQLRGKADCWQALALGIAYLNGTRSKDPADVIQESKVRKAKKREKTKLAKEGNS